jgi:hypothetical protein
LRPQSLQLSAKENGSYGSRLCENSARYKRTLNFEACGRTESKKARKSVLRWALRPNQIKFSHSLGQQQTSRPPSAPTGKRCSFLRGLPAGRAEVLFLSGSAAAVGRRAFSKRTDICFAGAVRTRTQIRALFPARVEVLGEEHEKANPCRRVRCDVGKHRECSGTELADAPGEWCRTPRAAARTWSHESWRSA